MKNLLAVLLVASIFVAGFATESSSEADEAAEDTSTIAALFTSYGFEVRKDSAGHFVRVYEHYWAYPVPATLSFIPPQMVNFNFPFILDTSTGKVVPGADAFNGVNAQNRARYCGDMPVGFVNPGDSVLVSDSQAQIVYSICRKMIGLPSFARITYVPAGDYRIVAQQSSNYAWIRIAGFKGEAWFFVPIDIPSLKVAKER